MPGVYAISLHLCFVADRSRLCGRTGDRRQRWALAVGALGAAALAVGCGATPSPRNVDGSIGGSADARVADAEPAAQGDAAELDGKNGFPGDFPEIVDSGGSGEGEPIQGFGGDTTTNRDGNRAALARRPVILLHGNGCNTEDERYGFTDVRDMLLAAGYVPAEIWAPSYLGQQISVAELPVPQRNNIEDVRHFIDAVLEYLDVPEVDVVAHSLGCGMINGYLRGLQPDGSFDADESRFDRVASVVCLSGALYGTGFGVAYEPEFNVLGSWVEDSLTWDGTEDATPFGASDVADMTAPESGTIPGSRAFRATTALDGGSRRIYYAAIWALDDVIDLYLENGSGLQGADLNIGLEMPDSMAGVPNPQLARHAYLLHEQIVVDTFLPFLDR